MFDLCWECGGELLNLQVCDVCLVRVGLQYWIKLDIFEETFTLTPGGADAIKKFTLSLGIPYVGDR